ncbi:glucosamine-6-phosphate deaminase [Planctomycetota bacterium]
MNENLNRLENLRVQIFETNEQASAAVARKIADLIRSRSGQEEKTVLGLATGRTPVDVYRQLIRMHRQEGLDFSQVVTFNLDEYWPIKPDSLQSYHAWMHENFFKSVNIPQENIYILRGDVAESKVADFCREYEQAIEAAGGIDLQILGIGRSGHIGFNEPGSGRNSRTRLIHLDRVTRKDAAGDFFGEENVPQMALTMGVDTILRAREICLMAFGEHKADIIRRIVEGEISDHIASSFLQEHPNTTLYIDESAAGNLTRMARCWELGSCQWDDVLQREAVVWLAQELNKPILKLTDEDYAEHGLYELIRKCGGAYHINIKIFKRLMKTITGYPVGKDEKKCVLILSPHPDDDVICMGGTMKRMIEQGHEVHTAYMVSGYLSVFDHDVARYADFVREFNTIFRLTPEQSALIEQHIDEFLRRKKPGEIDSPEIQAIKGLIRRTEAIDAARFCGLTEEKVHFLDMPFYDSGQVQKLIVSENDIAAVKHVLHACKPAVLFAAGDMSDPHGTHRLCLQAALLALEEYVGAGYTRPEIWLYRGAWQEWDVSQIDRVIPMTTQELQQKRYAIFRHQSQKDRAMFPGPYDSREFWQRAEERNMATAALYDALGLPEYHALEAFVRWPLEKSTNKSTQMQKN